MKTRIPPPFIGFLAALLILALDYLLPGARIDFPGQLIVTLVLVAASILVQILSIGRFRKVGTTINPLQPESAATLVTDGIFGLTRNPMYLSLALLLLALSVWLGNLIGLVVLAVFVVVITRWQIIPEEQALAAKFGDDFRQYKARVRRWL